MREESPLFPLSMRIALAPVAVGLLSTAASSVATAQGTTSAPASSRVVAFVDVTVIPMDRQRIIGGQTVIVRGDRIESIGPTGSISVPAGATRIEGRGKFLMPGLAEMHAHVLPA